MKPEYFVVATIEHGWKWKWEFAGVKSAKTYTRHSDAVRGFERFCRAIEKARKA